MEIKYNRGFNYINLFVFTILIPLLLSCENNPVKGYYFDLYNQQIYEFGKSELIIYNIKDSLQNKYSINVDNDKIIFNYNDKNIKINYLIDMDSLWLIDNEQLFLNNNEIKLVKFEFRDNLNPKLINNNYWHIKSKKTKDDFWINYNTLEDNEYGSMYGKKKNSSHLFFESFFDINQERYFNKYWIYKFKSYNWDPYGYLLIGVEKDLLEFRELRTFDAIILDNYNSEINEQLFGTWANVNSNKNHITFFSEKGRFYFGDTIFFQKNNFFKRIINEQSYFFYKDTIQINKDKVNNIGKESLGKKEIPFEIGFNTKFLIFNEPLDQILEVEKLTKDSLIIKNHTIGEKLLMKYIRVVD